MPGLVQRVVPLAVALGVLAAQPASAAFPGSPGRVFYVENVSSPEAASQPSLFSVLSDGTGARLLRSGAGSPAASPDGQSVLYLQAGTLASSRSDGTAEQRVPITPPTGGWVQQGTWGPDGKHVALITACCSAADPMANGEGGPRILEVSALDGTGQRRLASNAEWATWGVNNRIAYDRSTGPRCRKASVGRGGRWSFAATGRGAIAVTRPDGRWRRTIITGGAGGKLGCPGYPDWSPDGRHLAFTRAAAHGAPGSFGVYIARADGHQERRVAWADGPIAWSPDGRALALTTDTGIRVVSLATGASKMLVRDQASSPSWQPQRR